MSHALDERVEGEEPGSEEIFGYGGSVVIGVPEDWMGLNDNSCMQLPACTSGVWQTKYLYLLWSCSYVAISTILENNNNYY